MPNSKNPYYICNPALQFSLNFYIQLTYLESKKKAKDSFSKTKMLIIAMRKTIVYGSPKFTELNSSSSKTKTRIASLFATML